jgi:hypothetical protein
MTITVEVPSELESPLEQAAHLQGSDVRAFLLESVRLRLRRDILSQPEGNLLQLINKALPTSVRAERDALIAERDQRSLSDAEETRLSDLIDEIEVANAERWQAIADLAKIRGLSLREMATELEIPIR